MSSIYYVSSKSDSIQGYANEGRVSTIEERNLILQAFGEVLEGAVGACCGCGGQHGGGGEPAAAEAPDRLHLPALLPRGPLGLRRPPLRISSPGQCQILLLLYLS